jgi:uncharacterized damage-inducible protein DinB
MHIAISNFYLLSVTGPKMPADLNENMEKAVTSKADVIAWLKRSLEAVKEAHEATKPGDLERKVKIYDRDSTVDDISLRIIIHANEHMGQLIAYARMTGVVPPWSSNNQRFFSQDRILSERTVGTLGTRANRTCAVIDHQMSGNRTGDSPEAL